MPSFPMSHYVGLVVIISVALLLTLAPLPGHVNTALGQGASATEAAQLADYDTDNDDLIEITTLEQLNAIRWDLDGDGVPVSADSTSYAAAFPNAAADMGCATTCAGYELNRSLDFNDDASYAATSHKATWTTCSGWEPLGSGEGSAAFRSTFEGNGQTIANLFINRTYASDAYVGLFGAVDGGTLRHVEMVGGSINGTATNGNIRVGGLVGYNRGTISASYATGVVSASGTGAVIAGSLVGYNRGTISASYATGAVSASGTGAVIAGSLVGYNRGTISASYATGAVSASGAGPDMVGGLVGHNGRDATVLASYATGAVSVTTGTFGYAGGLVGSNGRDATVLASYATGAVGVTTGTFGYAGSLMGFSLGTISASYATGAVTSSGSGDALLGGLVGYNLGADTASYWDMETSGQSTGVGGAGKTTSELQTPTNYTDLGSNAETAYTFWNLDLDNADSDDDPNTGGDDPWDFGTTAQYPVLKYGGLKPSEQRPGPADSLSPTATPSVGVAPQSIELGRVSESGRAAWERQFSSAVGPIDPRFVKNGEVAYLARFIFASEINANEIPLQIELTGSRADGGHIRGPEFTDDFEESGIFTLTSGDNCLAITGIPDTEEPYVWTPSNTAEVRAFVTAVLAMPLARRTGTLTLSLPSAPAGPDVPDTPTVPTNRDTGAVTTSTGDTSQTIDLGRVSESGRAAWERQFSSAVGPIDPRFVKNGEVAYLARFIFASEINASEIPLQIELTGSRADGGHIRGPEFTDEFEARGTFTLTAGDNSLVIALAITGIPDTEEPYVWTPSNTAEVRAFVTAVLAMPLAARTGTLTLSLP